MPWRRVTHHCPYDAPPLLCFFYARHHAQLIIVMMQTSTHNSAMGPEPFWLSSTQPHTLHTTTHTPATNVHYEFHCTVDLCYNQCFNTDQWYTTCLKWLVAQPCNVTLYVTGAMGGLKGPSIGATSHKPNPKQLERHHTLELRTSKLTTNTHSLQQADTEFCVDVRKIGAAEAGPAQPDAHFPCLAHHRRL